MKFIHNMSRIEAFSDAVFAFAATLMVVSLDTDNSLELIRGAQISSFISLGIVFFALVLLWKVHYDFFRRTTYIDNWIILFNSILLFVTLYFVFPLKSLVSTQLDQQALSLIELASLFELYGLGFLLIFLCYSLMYFRAYSKSKEGENRSVLLFYARHFSVFAAVALISIVIAIAEIGGGIGLPGFVYFLIGPLCYFNSIWFNKKIKNKP